MGKRRVVVTGLGTVNPVGNDVETTWSNVRKGKVGIAAITAYDASADKVKLAAEVKGFEPELRIRKRDIKHLSRYAQFAIYASEEAISGSGITDSIGSVYASEEIGVIISSGIGGVEVIEKEYPRGAEKGFDRTDPFFITKSIPNMGAAQVAILHGFQGMCSCLRGRQYCDRRRLSPDP